MSAKDIVALILNELVPVLVAGLFALVPALTELRSVFRNRLRDVLRTSTGWYILILNAGVAIATYSAARWFLGVQQNLLLLAALIGVTFPSVLRTPLTFFSLVEHNELIPHGFNALSDFYQGLLEEAMRRADVLQADRRAQIVERLAAKYDLEFMRHKAHLNIGQLARQGEQQLARASFDAALATPDEYEKRIALASLLLDICPEATIAELLAGKNPVHVPSH